MIRELSREDLIDFRNVFLSKATELITEKLEDLLSDYSEDSLEEVTEWVVSQGWTYYSNVLGNPENALPSEVLELDDSFTDNSFSGCVEDEFFGRYKESITEYE